MRVRDRFCCSCSIVLIDEATSVDGATRKVGVDLADYKSEVGSSAIVNTADEEGVGSVKNLAHGLAVVHRARVLVVESRETDSIAVARESARNISS